MTKKIILGVSSSIAAYKAYDLARLFKKDNCEIHTVLTENALNLVSALTFETLTGQPVYVHTYSDNNREMKHINLKDDADLLCIAPATANIIGKCAHGIADDLLSTTYLSVTCPVCIAPAMNPNMYAHPAVQSNIELLKTRGVSFIEPSEGVVACGDEGYGKLADINDIYKLAMELCG